MFICNVSMSCLISPTVHADEQLLTETYQCTYALLQYLLPTTRYDQVGELDHKYRFHYSSNKPDILSSYQFFIPHLTIMICHQIRTR